MVTTHPFEPRSAAARNATITFAPVDVPAKMPSTLASRRAMAMASPVETVATSSIGAGSQSGTTNPAPTPSIRCAPVLPPERTADSLGSIATVLMEGLFDLRNSEIPRADAAVPVACTNVSTLPSVCRQISAPRRSAERSDPSVAWLGWKEPHDEQPWTGNTGYPDLPLRHNAPEHRAQIGLARNGPYLTLLPCFLGDTAEGLQRVPEAALLPDRSIWLLYRTDLRRTARVRLLRDALIAHFEGRKAFYVGRARSPTG